MHSSLSIQWFYWAARTLWGVVIGAQLIHIAYNFRLKKTVKMWSFIPLTPLLSLLFFMLSEWIGTFAAIPTRRWCCVPDLIGVPLLYMGKTFMYLYFVWRLHISFRNTIFEYRRRNLLILSAVIILVNLGLPLSLSPSLSLCHLRVVYSREEYGASQRQTQMVYIMYMEHCGGTTNYTFLRWVKAVKKNISKNQ